MTNQQRKGLKEAFDDLEEKLTLVNEALNDWDEAKHIVSEQIRTTRLRKRITYKMLAEKVGVSKAFLNDIELGRRFPSQDIMKKIKKALI